MSSVRPIRFFGTRAALALVPLVALAGVLGIGRTQDKAQREQSARLTIAHLRAEAGAQDAAAWRAIADGRVDAALASRVRRAFAGMYATVQAVDDHPSARRTLLPAMLRFENALGDELDHIASGRLAEARRLDTIRVEPAFAALEDALRREEAEHARRADAAERVGDVALWLIAVMTLCSVSGVFLLFHRARARRLEAELREESLERTVRDREHDANHDALTGLLNRRGLLEQVDAALAEARTDGSVGAVLLLDIDRFKEVNDALGHTAGDALLAELGPRLAPLLREVDCLARLGGDELAVLMRPGGRLSRRAAERLAARMRAAIAAPFVFDGLPVQLQASVGIAMFPRDGAGADDVLRCADVAMYRAKRDRSGAAVYDASMEEDSRARLAMTAQLRRALAEDELVVHFQPKARVRDGAVAGVEALVRWEHPERGLLAPGIFLDAVERAGLMHELTVCVLDQAIEQAACWAQEGLDLQVAVNLPEDSLRQVDLPGEVMALLARHDVPPHRLRLEVTEDVIMRDPLLIGDVVGRLAGHGIGISLDDFGTGYSSLAHLKRLAVDELKIDRAFIDGMAPGNDDAIIVRSTIEMARNLNLTVVAEGVETEAAWRQLEELGCDEVQGYLLGRPLAAGELTPWLHARRRPSAAPRG